MKLVASMVVAEGEHARYLDACVDHLGEFCDLIVVQVDGPLFGATYARLEDKIKAGAQILVYNDERLSFFEHEGRARQNLLDMTLHYEPTHVLAIDADELVDDGPALRRSLETWDGAAFGLVMEEVWEAEDDHLCVREDGGWRSHPIPAVWRVPEQMDAAWRIADRALACGRVPRIIDQQTFAPIGSLLHFGWANEAERQARYDRYVEHDGGRFHASHHLQSILAPCDRVALRAREWPAGLDAYKAQILERANGVRA